MGIFRDIFKENKKGILLFIVIVALLVLTTTVYFALFRFPSGEIDLPLENILNKNESVVASSSLPARLFIPAIQVDADVQHLGITKEGNMAAPKNYTDVGWYKYGTVPGMKGSAVISGHLDNGFSMPAVFKRLSELKPGDDIFVRTIDGKDIHFVVESSELHKLDESPRERIFMQDDAVRLNLITCEGWWTQDYKTFDHRRVIYAKLKN